MRSPRDRLSLQHNKPATAAPSNAVVPGSGTGVAAVGVMVEKDGKSEALPTIKLDPSAIASLLVATSVPASTNVPPS